jgi:hypothetical protein
MFAGDIKLDARPMVTPMCAMCSQDIAIPEHAHRWGNGAMAHPYCVPEDLVD